MWHALINKGDTYMYCSMAGLCDGLAEVPAFTRWRLRLLRYRTGILHIMTRQSQHLNLQYTHDVAGDVSLPGRDLCCLQRRPEE